MKSPAPFIRFTGPSRRSPKRPPRKDRFFVPGTVAKGAEICGETERRLRFFPSFDRLYPEVILMDAKKFGAFLAAVRRENGLTQKALAEKLYVTDKAVSRWERGIGLPDVNTLEPLSEALGVSVLELIRSEKGNDDGDHTAELISAAAAILQANTRQEYTATALAIFTTLVSGLLFYTGGLGNWGGSLFFGALLSAAQVSLFYLLEGRKDRTSRIIYTVSGLLAVTAAGLLLLLSL